MEDEEQGAASPGGAGGGTQPQVVGDQQQPTQEDQPSDQGTEGGSQAQLSKNAAAASSEDGAPQPSPAKKKIITKSAEESVGITVYAGNHEGFFGIIKQRYSDFLVNEVDSSGKIVAITDQTIPDVPQDIPELPKELPPELTPEKINEINKLAGVVQPRRLNVPPPQPVPAPQPVPPPEANPPVPQALGEEEATKIEVENEVELKHENGVVSGGSQEAVKDSVSVKEEPAAVVEAAPQTTTQDVAVAAETTTEGTQPNKAAEENAGAETLQGKKRKEGEEDMVMIDVSTATKEARTAIHRTIKAKYRNVNSTFKEMNNKRYIIVKKKKLGGGHWTHERTPSWPKGQQYTTFVLYKENVDTMQAINYLARRLRVKPNNFAYAGTKDKRGKTSQLVSVCQVPPAKLWQVTRYQEGLKVGNFRFRPVPQKLGDLQGNHFRIVLREVKGSDEVIQSAIDSLKETGFINYYGTQRFGTTSIPTHAIGRELLKSNWQQAINLILAPRDNDSPELNRCRQTWKDSGDAESALDVLPRGWESSTEAQLLMGLVKQGNDLVGALNRIPRNTRMLYLHSYQSYIWNVVVSRRLAKYGLKVLPGDIVRRKLGTHPPAADDAAPAAAAAAASGTDEASAGAESGGEGQEAAPGQAFEGEEDVGESGMWHSDVTLWWNDEVTKAIKEKKDLYRCSQAEGLTDEERAALRLKYQKAKQRAKRVVLISKRKASEEMVKYFAKLKKLSPEALEEEIHGQASDSDKEDERPNEEGDKESKSSFHLLTAEEAETTDISEVLLPLPGHNVTFPANELKDWYTELLTADGLTVDGLKHRVRSYAVGGVYRRIMVKPSNVSNSICYYDDATRPLVPSDVDTLRNVDVSSNRLTEGQHKAVVVEMTLPTSSYATVALRELLKMDTSSQFQATLNPALHPVEWSKEIPSAQHRNQPWVGPDKFRGRGGHFPGTWWQPQQGFRGNWRGGDHGMGWQRGWGGGRGRGGNFRGGGYWGRGDWSWGGGWRGGGYRGGRGAKRNWEDSKNAKRGRYV